jgi:hypothetical protein
VAGHRHDVRLGVGRPADGRHGRDGVEERLPRQDLGRPQVLVGHLDGATPRLVGHLSPLAVRRGDGRDPGSDIPSTSATAFIVEAVPMVLQ